MGTISTTAVALANYLEWLLTPLLKNLDPSDFQNIILGILAIFIPFAIVFLSDVVSAKEKPRSEFEKMVWNEEILHSKQVFWLSILGLAALSFFSGKDICLLEKLVAILITFLLVVAFGGLFTKTLRFSEGYKSEFELSFLKKLKLATIFTYGNRLKEERMIRAWGSFWAETSTISEKDFTQVFISHIDNAIEAENYSLGLQLVRIYAQNIEGRDPIATGSLILPKIFEWHKVFLGIETDNHAAMAEVDYSVDYRYIQRDFFPMISKMLLQKHNHYELFKHFKKHVEEVLLQLEQLEGATRESYWYNHIVGLFGSFCPMFFEGITEFPDDYNLLHHYFPKEWKATSSGSEDRISRVILNEFIEWTGGRIFTLHKTGEDSSLSRVVNGLFPDLHHDLFPTFLTLYFSGDIKSAIQRDINFTIFNQDLSWSGEKTAEDIQKMREDKDTAQKNETVALISRYFYDHWDLLRYFKSDMTEEEFSNWASYTEEQRQVIINRIRKSKLKTTLNELSSEGVKNLCKDSTKREHRRQILIELIQLLLAKIPE